MMYSLVYVLLTYFSIEQLVSVIMLIEACLSDTAES